MKNYFRQSLSQLFLLALAQKCIHSFATHIVFCLCLLHATSAYDLKYVKSIERSMNISITYSDFWQLLKTVFQKVHNIFVEFKHATSARSSYFLK